MSNWPGPGGASQGPPGQYQPGHGVPPQGGYYLPGQRAPYQPMYVASPPGNGVAVAALVIGITCVVFSWWGLFTLVQVVLAIVFGSVGISKANRGANGKGMAVAGLVLGLIGLVIYFFIGLLSFGLGWLI